MSGIQVGWGKSWELLANAINDWYGGGIDGTQYKQVVQMLNSGEYTMEQMEGILQEIPDFVASYNGEGKLIGVTYKAKTAGNTAAGAAANAVNSNVANATQTQFQTVQNITKDAQTGKVTMSDTVTKYNAGTASSAKAIAGSAVAAVCAASAGIAVGKMVDTLLYNANPDFWDEHGMSSLNPETWSSITAGDNSFGAKLFNYVFTLDDASDGNPQAYIDENTFAYMVAYMMSEGVFDGDYVFPDIDDNINTYYVGGTARSIQKNIYNGMSKNIFNYYQSQLGGNLVRGVTLKITVDGVTYTTPVKTILTGWKDENVVHINEAYDVSDALIPTYGTSQNSINASAIETYDENNNRIGSGSGVIYKYEYDGNVKYIWFSSTSIDKRWTWNPANELLYNYYAPFLDNAQISGDYQYYGSFPWFDYEITGGVDGITPQQGVTQFDTSGISDPTDISSVLAALMAQYPELWDNRIEVSPDGETTIKYIPVGFPTGGTGEQPTTNGATATDLAPDISGDGENATDELIKTLIDMIQNPQTQNGMESDTDTPTEPIDPNMPSGGSGVTPPFVIPTGSASALYSVYNPSQSQLNSLGAWLWSSNFVDQLLKLFNDPMQAIIGLHKIFATPPTSGTGTIKVGYLDSGVGSNLVSAQYTEVDCGSVSMPEYFKNALDYLKTDIYLYLPFVGIVPLNVEDVTRATINVKYKVDVLTGACLASVNVTRDAGGGGQLYVYAGNCAVQYPLSSGSYMGIIAGVLGIAGGVASSVLSGGALLPMALGAGASAMGNMRTKVEHSGSLSGNSGAMGIKKPYLIIRRPQTKIADNFQLLAGESQNEYGVLSSYTGQTRVKYVHLENIPATDNELTQIEELLKSGVLI